MMSLIKFNYSVQDFDNALRYGLRTSGVWHRYSEFDLLYQYLLHTYPSHIIPPLPEKKVSIFLNYLKFDFTFLFFIVLR